MTVVAISGNGYDIYIWYIRIKFQFSKPFLDRNIGFSNSFNSTVMNDH